ncbi:Hypothetical protein GLP15_441 [Giardia lamblia P15]|uniref:Uncharacterized protein n=1 Tax=Giardia intestinalis (strain P15) TaxID=658858 RepID=E1F078_GIAIA|nr:Hypothetical protein GLP15_441 [Giardia lamblia P15]
MFGYITCATTSITLDRFKTVTHAELRLCIRSCTKPPNIMAISSTVFTPLQLKDKRKGTYTPKSTDITLPIPLLNDLDAHELCISVLLAEVAKDSTTVCTDLVHVCSRTTLAEILAGRTVEETAPLSIPATSPCTDHINLSFSYRKPLRKANSAAHECLRLDTLLIQLADVLLPLSKRSYLDDQHLCLRVCTQTYASEFPLTELPREHSTKRSYRLASPVPIFIPYSPVITFQVVFLYKVTVSETFFQLNGLQMGSPSANSHSFCDYVPIFQWSVNSKKNLYKYQSFGVPLSIYFPPSLVSSDLVSFYDVICTSLQLAADPAHKKTPRSLAGLLEHLKEAVIPHIFEGIFLRGEGIADVFSPYRSTIIITNYSKSDSTRFKAYEKILQFAGLTDTLLAAVGKNWTDMAVSMETEMGCSQSIIQNRILFVATFLLDMFEPYSSSAAKRNNITYPDSISASTSGPSESSSSLQRFESLNCASRARDMLYAFSSKRQHKDAATSCITILPIEFSLANTLVSNKMCIYTISFSKDGADNKRTFHDAVPIVVSRPELSGSNRGLWQFTLEERRDRVEMIAAGPVLSTTQSKMSIDRVLLGCKNNAELTFANYLWILPQVLFLPDSVSSQQMIRDRVTAFEKYILVACLYDFETGALLARGNLRLRNVTDTFISAAASDLDVEIKLRWFYEQEFSSSVEGVKDTVTFLASCYGFLKELEPAGSPHQSTHNSANVSICGKNSACIVTTENSSRPISAPLEVPVPSSMYAEAANCSLVRENSPDCPEDLSTIEYVRVQAEARQPTERSEIVSRDDKGLRTPRLLSGKEIEIIDGTITFQFAPSQRQSASGPICSISNNTRDEISVLKQLIHTLRKDLERLTPKTFKQAVAASPSTYAGLEHPISEDLRQKVEVSTGLVMQKEGTTYEICQTIAERLDRNILAYLLVDMVKQNVQLSKELDGTRDKIDILECACNTNDAALSKLKVLVLEQEQLLQYMEAQRRRSMHTSTESAERLAAIEKENARLAEILRAVTASLGKDSAAKLIPISRNPAGYTRAQSSPSLDDGRSGVLLSVKLPPGRLPPLSPDPEALSPHAAGKASDTAKRKIPDQAVILSRS